MDLLSFFGSVGLCAGAFGLGYFYATGRAKRDDARRLNAKPLMTREAARSLQLSADLIEANARIMELAMENMQLKLDNAALFDTKKEG